MPDGKKTSMTTKELKSHVAFAPATQNLKFFCFEWPPPSHLFVNVYVGINYISHFIQHLYGGHFFFRGSVWIFLGGSWFYAFLFLWFSGLLLLCFYVSLLFCFIVSLFFVFPASLLFLLLSFLFFLLLCFSASLFSPLLCFLASYFYFPCVFHFPSLDSILSVS